MKECLAAGRISLWQQHRREGEQGQEAGGRQCWRSFAACDRCASPATLRTDQS